MRVIIGGSSLAVLLALIIVIHTSVINKSVREDEINRGLENATDYSVLLRQVILKSGMMIMHSAGL